MADLILTNGKLVLPSGVMEGGGTGWSSSLGVSVVVVGSSAPNGTAATLSVEDLFDSQPVGTGDSGLGNATFYDVKITGISDGSATVCVNASSITNSTAMRYYNFTGGDWVYVSTTFVPLDTVCGAIPVSALSGTLIALGSPPLPLDESFTAPVSPTVTTIGVTKALNVTLTNNLKSRFSAIIWFQVNDATSGQEVAVVGTSLTLDSHQRGSVYLALSTFAPGSYKVTAFAVTIQGVVLSPNVVKLVTLP